MRVTFFFHTTLHRKNSENRSQLPSRKVQVGESKTCRTPLSDPKQSTRLAAKNSRKMPFRNIHSPSYPLVCAAGSLVACAVADSVLRFLGDRDKTRRWFVIHAVVNGLVTVTLFPDVVRVLRNPLISLDVSEDYDVGPMCFTLGLHVFHCLSSLRTLSALDWAHHIVSNFLNIFMAIYVFPGPLSNFVTFFMCGLPGGLDYVLLAAQKYGAIEKITEKRINCYLNMYFRSPGLTFSIAYFTMLKTLDIIPHSWWIVIPLNMAVGAVLIVIFALLLFLFQVPPAELEGVIASMPSVTDCIVIPVLDDEAGE